MNVSREARREQRKVEQWGGEVKEKGREREREEKGRGGEKREAR